ncbi:hypothetical protein B0H13DRAFT_1931309 [Mycena leptocephala]|nr:hypothetical protein B0H13DRAFT_1931309 [Mycena leptocephala]
MSAAPVRSSVWVYISDHFPNATLNKRCTIYRSCVRCQAPPSQSNTTDPQQQQHKTSAATLHYPAPLERVNLDDEDEDTDSMLDLVSNTEASPLEMYEAFCTAMADWPFGFFAATRIGRSGRIPLTSLSATIPIVPDSPILLVTELHPSSPAGLAEFLKKSLQFLTVASRDSVFPDWHLGEQNCVFLHQFVVPCKPDGNFEVLVCSGKSIWERSLPFQLPSEFAAKRFSWKRKLRWPQMGAEKARSQIECR